MVEKGVWNHFFTCMHINICCLDISLWCNIPIGVRFINCPHIINQIFQNIIPLSNSYVQYGCDVMWDRNLFLKRVVVFTPILSLAGGGYSIPSAWIKMSLIVRESPLSCPFICLSGFISLQYVHHHPALPSFTISIAYNKISLAQNNYIGIIVLLVSSCALIYSIVHSSWARIEIPHPFWICNSSSSSIVKKVL